MSNKGANSTTADKNPEKNKLKLSIEMFVQYVEQNLAQVQADTARMQAELEDLQKLKKKMMDDQIRALQAAGLPVFADCMNLMPTLKQMVSKTEGMLRQLTKLIDAKANLNQAYSGHCKEAKAAMELHLKSGYDRYTSMSDKDIRELTAQVEKDLKEAVARTALKKAELANKKKEYEAIQKDIMKDITALTQVEQGAIKLCEQLELKKALSNDVAPD